MFSASHPDPLSVRAVSFMRALMNYDYGAAKTKMSIRQVRFMLQYPSRDFVTIFDFGTGYLDIRIQPMGPENYGDLAFLGIPCEEHVARATRSGGQMELHLMPMMDGARTSPFRTNNHSLRDGLRRIAREIPRSSNNSELSPEVLERIRALVQDTGQLRFTKVIR
ncbi:hypothetical protein B0H10DRAFT_2230575 [Mycena sp. CBHHK59/15]|nr:hypothetical protein B0H10DRAFT_2230575 [Mycena sp. CBHHK59/15]